MRRSPGPKELRDGGPAIHRPPQASRLPAALAGSASPPQAAARSVSSDLPSRWPRRVRDLRLYQPFKGDGVRRRRVDGPAGLDRARVRRPPGRPGVVSSEFFFSLHSPGSRAIATKLTLRPTYTVPRRHEVHGAAVLAAPTTAPKAAPVVNITIPEGPSRRGGEAPRRGPEGQLPRRDEALGEARPARLRGPAHDEVPRGLPVPVDLPAAGQPGDGQAARQPPARRVPGPFEQVTMRRAKAPQPQPLRRADHRLDDRARGAGPARPPAHRRGHLQPSAAGHPARDRRDAALCAEPWSRPLRVSELNSGSRFNTRPRDGLPPTPIGNPGLAALKAAANPANVSYLYYVVRPGGNGAHA